MAEALRGEWMCLWIIVVLSPANVVLGVWRPQCADALHRDPVKLVALARDRKPCGRTYRTPMDAESGRMHNLSDFC